MSEKKVIAKKAYVAIVRGHKIYPRNHAPDEYF